MKMLLLFIILVVFPVTCNANYIGFVELPLDTEIELALSALPDRLREGAAIYVHDKKEGYRLHKKGDNGFITFVARSTPRFYQADWDYSYPPDQLIPVSFDSVGVKHHMIPYFDLEKMRSQGVAANKAKATLKKNFASGYYTAPKEGGISYMLAPIHRAYADPDNNGLLQTYSHPHYMPYSPFVTAKQLGNNNPMNGGPFALGHGGSDAGPHGYLVFMLREQEIKELQKQYAGLLDRLCDIHPNWCLPIN